MEREDVTFPSGGDEIAAWRYRPVGAQGGEPHACVILAHGFGGTRYRPIRRAALVSCPLPVAICDRDVVTLPGPAVSAAARAPRGEVRAYHGGHFDICRGDLFERAVADETEFLLRHLRVGE